MTCFIKIISILCVLICINTPTYAESGQSKLSWSTISEEAKSFIGTGNNSNFTLLNGATQELVTGLASILTTIGVIIVLIGLLVIGIKYMMATPEEAAKLKTKLVGIVISGIVIIGAWGIWNLTYTFFNSIT